MNRPSLVLVLALALALLAPGPTPSSAVASAASPAAAPCASDLAALLARFDQAVAARDSSGMMALCRPADANGAERLAQRFLPWRALDSLTCRSRLGPVVCSGSHAEAAVFRRLEWREYGRAQTWTSWATTTFRRDGAGWAIDAETDRDYARARFTDLQVRLDPDKGTLRGTATVHVGFELPGEDNLLLALNRGLEIDSMRDTGGATMPFTRVADAIVVPLGAPAHKGDSLTVHVEFRGTPFNESAENHYSQISVAPEGSFASWVTEWYPRVQGPGSKSRGRIVFDVPAGLTVAASGRPNGRSTAGDRERHVFDVAHPLDFSFAAARYLHDERVVDGITVGAFFLTGGEAKAERYLDASASALRVSRDRYGMYPYDSYAVVEIPNKATGGLGGSSEQGMNLFPVGVLPDSTVPFALLAHEIGHSWWGNLVESPGALDEAFAQYTSALCLRDLQGEAAMRHFLVWGQPELPGQCQLGYFERFAGRPESDRPIGAQLLGGADSGLLHDLCDTKGFNVLDMLRQRIGDRAFVQGLRSMLHDFAGRKAQLSDFQTAWEKASGRKLERFMRQWFDQTGAPELALEDTVVTAGKKYRVRGRILQRRAPYDLDVEVVAVLPTGTSVQRIHVVGPETPVSFVVSARPTAVLLDPDHKVLRWCDEFDRDGLVRRATRLRGDGEEAEAIDTLTLALRRDPDETVAHYELGLLHQSAGRLEAAADQYRDVTRAFDAYPAYAPAVAWSFLHLGEVSDLLGRRDSALAAYRRVLALPNESGSHAQATGFLGAPYVAPTGAPDSLRLRTFEGTYTSAAVGSLVVSLRPSGILQIQQAGAPASPLEWKGGDGFDVVMRPGMSVEFTDDAGGHAAAMVLHIGAHDIRMPRTP
ncbi:MAG: M1 family aminopeptidase [Hyphomicrobiales bacterium]